MTKGDLAHRAAAWRSFNRFYTQQIGVLTDHLLDTPYSLPQARVLFELAHSEIITASRLALNLFVDASYMSRVIASLVEAKLVKRTRSQKDGRQWMLELTPRGKKEFELLNSRSAALVESDLQKLEENQQVRLLQSMAAIEEILTDHKIGSGPIMIRNHRAGDIGWIVERHGIIYNNEYAFDETFEALVAEILAKMIKDFNPKKDSIFISEVDGERAGTLSVTQGKPTGTAQLRLFLVEPWARRHGIGRMLLQESLKFAKQAGYRKAMLWTQSVLEAARRLYESVGFRLVSEEDHTSFSRDLTAQVWELDLK